MDELIPIPKEESFSVEAYYPQIKHIAKAVAN